MSGRSRKPMRLNIEVPTAQSIKTPDNLDRRTSIKLDDKSIDIVPEDIESLQELGRGAYGIVEKVRHRPSGHQMAVKRINAANVQEEKKLLMDMNVLLNSVGCPQIVKFYGAIFWEGDLWLFMELMDASLDKFYRLAYKIAATEEINPIPEEILGKIARSVVKALHYLYEMKVIHRDVKPSNILISCNGEVKLCDFGISGHLVNSIAQTFDAGCKPYMAPERINPSRERPGYDIRSDVWSLGLSMLEIAIGKFPYPNARNLFEQLKRVCNDEPPRLPPARFSSDFEDFIEKCLQKEYQKRPYYTVLIDHPFITKNENNDISPFVTKVLRSEDTASV